MEKDHLPATVSKMWMFKFISATTTRALFILVSLVGIWRVAWVKHDATYWLLAVLFLPLLLEMVVTLKSRNGRDYKCIIPSIWILELHHQQEKAINPQSLNQVFKTICPNAWILALHQSALLLVIVGRWLLPLGGGVTRDELSQLLLIFVGTAADILEFTSETMSDVKDNSQHLVYIILAVWTLSMLQFPLHVAVGNSKADTDGEEAPSEVSLLAKHSADIWSIVGALFIQDGPFLVVRLTVMTYFQIFHQMLVFFTIKNFLVVTLNLYRLVVISMDSRSRAGRGSAIPSV
ncbi:transmembrane protein 26-like isoform 6-T7 [Spinachia spinachia]